MTMGILFIFLMACTVGIYIWFVKAGKDSYQEVSQIPLEDDELHNALDNSEERTQ
jgi:cbb3-type cytochrome oxidase subunit 3